ncbi:hypothetical protein NC653_035191 [Populus alba x Populus x berolinensis]|uniref:E2 ubiquitin-conjugating enzyme n=1 Tax=Populus alba x Populus x berolinensis TaxID=444605 RepID=A0AAD6PWY7_9ROSI|nr:hypothetical protein NC653_035191 [Populus alba x Populus x berolinensis]
MIDFARVQKELQECSRDMEASGIKVAPKSDNLGRLTGTIPGPIGTPYEGGTFQIDITLPDGYPFEPPKMQFATKVCCIQSVLELIGTLIIIFAVITSRRHPNISSQSGAICLDILKDQWSPALTLKTALLSVQALLSAPEPDDPQDAVVAQQYLRDYQTFVGTARYWTETFAKTSSLGVEEKVQKLVEMGFPEALARGALESVGGDENLALEKLCSG